MNLLQCELISNERWEIHVVLCTFLRTPLLQNPLSLFHLTKLSWFTRYRHIRSLPDIVSLKMFAKQWGFVPVLLYRMTRCSLAEIASIVHSGNSGNWQCMRDGTVVIDSATTSEILCFYIVFQSYEKKFWQRFTSKLQWRNNGNVSIKRIAGISRKPSIIVISILCQRRCRGLWSSCE